MERTTARFVGGYNIAEVWTDSEEGDMKMDKTVWRGIPEELTRDGMRDLFKHRAETFGIEGGIQRQWVNIMKECKTHTLEIYVRGENEELSVYGEGGNEKILAHSWRATYLKDDLTDVSISYMVWFPFNGEEDTVQKRIVTDLKEACARLHIQSQRDQQGIIERIVECVKRMRCQEGSIEVGRSTGEEGVRLSVIAGGSIVDC